jgi:hypothetical protein
MNAEALGEILLIRIYPIYQNASTLLDNMTLQKMSTEDSTTSHRILSNPKKAFMKYVHRYHATLAPRYLSEEEAAKLGPEWSETYIHHEYPKCKYHRTKAAMIVNDADKEAALGAGWANSPGAFKDEAAIVTAERSDPLRWVNDWQVPNLLLQHRENIKAQLLKAEAAFARESPTSISRHVAPMRQAFNGIAEVLFEARILTEQLLEKEIPNLIWDSAIGGGWWRHASDEHTAGFPEQLGHYWVWADHGKDCARLFRAEKSEWVAELLARSAQDSVQSTWPLPEQKG